MIAPVVTSSWPAHQTDEVVLADVRWYLDGRSRVDAYRAGHLPGARFVDLERWLSDSSDASLGRHTLPTPEVFGAGMRALGVDRSSVVVAYDDAGGSSRPAWSGGSEPRGTTPRCSTAA